MTYEQLVDAIAKRIDPLAFQRFNNGYKGLMIKRIEGDKTRMSAARLAARRAIECLGENGFDIPSTTGEHGEE